MQSVQKDVTVVTVCKQVAAVFTVCKKVMTVFTPDCLIWEGAQSRGTTPHSRIASARAMFTTCADKAVKSEVSHDLLTQSRQSRPFYIQ